MKRKYLLILIIVLGLGLALYLYFTEARADIYYTSGWILAVMLLLYIGNNIIARLFDNHLPWLKFGSKRLFAHLFLGIVYSLVIINLAYLLFKYLFTDEPPTSEQIIVTNAYGLVLFIPVFCIYFSLHFLRHWKKSEVETEKFKKETLKSQLDNLKNHLDPHFLFNNLNILSSLIDYNKEESKLFLDKFADVYRALLKTKEEDLITLADELEFINAYIYLLKTRFEDTINFTVNVDGPARLKMVPPLTLQMLVENAIKHNMISEKRPLEIVISATPQVLTVRNSLNEKPTDARSSSGSGLDNIRQRYTYFSDQAIKVIKAEDEFYVEVPLLEIETV